MVEPYYKTQNLKPMDHELIAKLCSRIEALENENIELRARLDKLDLVNKIVFKSNIIAFDIGYFLKNQTIEYLKMFDLDRGGLFDICMNLHMINSQCIKYLIDLHLDGTYKYDKHPSRNHGCTTPFLCGIFRLSNEEVISYLLNMCIEKDFIKVLDLIENGNTPLMSVCKFGTLQTIKCCIDFFAEKGLRLESKSKSKNKTLEYFVHTNTNPLVNTVMYMYLNSVEYTEFCTV